MSLYAVQTSYAVFVETDTPVDVRSAQTFMKAAQFENAKRVITMPIESFHRVAQEIEVPQGRVVFLLSTGRSGSTLLCKMLQSTDPKQDPCRVLVEPDVFMSMGTLRAPPSEEAKLAGSCLKLLCKDDVHSPTVIKLTGPGITIVPTLHRIHPKAGFLFLYREALPTARSFSRVTQVDPLLSVVSAAYELFPGVLKLFLDKVLGVSRDDMDKLRGHLHLGSAFVLAWAISCRTYLDLREKSFIPVRGVKYEHILDERDRMGRLLLEYCGLRANAVGRALESFEKDSQSDTMYSRENLARTKPVDFESSEVRRECDVICDIYSVPRVNVPCVLEGTLL